MQLLHLIYLHSHTNQSLLDFITVTEVSKELGLLAASL